MAHEYEGNMVNEFSAVECEEQDLEAYIAIIDQIRDVTGLHTCPVQDLPGLIEDIISNLACQNVSLAAAVEAQPAATSCRGCLRLTEIDGRLVCSEARSRMYGALLHWPGPGCVWASAGDAVYGGGS